MTSNIDDELVNSIVAGVLDRLRGDSAPSEKFMGPASPTAMREPVRLAERVITQALLEAKLDGANAVRFVPKAILTPTARDYLRVNSIDWEFAAQPHGESKPSLSGSWAALVVKAGPAVERVVADVLCGARIEMLDCPDDAAQLAIAEIARGGFSQAVLFAEQAHRAACLANRHESVKAVAVRDVADVLAIRNQLRANVWCVDPADRSYFELRNIVKSLKH